MMSNIEYWKSKKSKYLKKMGSNTDDEAVKFAYRFCCSKYAEVQNTLRRESV